VESAWLAVRAQCIVALGIFGHVIGGLAAAAALLSAWASS
jgi:hypothetical protein